MTATAIDLDNPACPKCGSKMWDNRATKKNPKAPDFKCRDRSCEGVIWPPKGPQQPQAPAAVAASRNVKQPHSAGGPLPFETEAVSGAADVALSPVPSRLDAEAIRRTFAADYTWAATMLPSLHEEIGVPLTSDTVYKAAYSVWSERLRRGAY